MKIRDERDELEKMIKKSTTDATKNVASSEEETINLQPTPIINVDFEKIKEKCEKEARAMIKNAISFIIPMDMIKDNIFLRDKFKVDVMSLAGMIYQLRSNEVMQKALMEQINLGAIHPRYWEVYTGMSKSIGELNKQLLQTVEAIQQTYKTFKENVKEKRTEALGPASTNSSGMLTTGDGGIVTRGTKELINRVKLLKNQKDPSLNIFLDDNQLIPDIPVGDNS